MNEMNEMKIHSLPKPQDEQRESWGSNRQSLHPIALRSKERNFPVW
jgi:hypothetical protein